MNVSSKLKKGVFAMVVDSSFLALHSLSCFDVMHMLRWLVVYRSLRRLSMILQPMVIEFIVALQR
jgi:hypothetical protein